MGKELCFWDKIGSGSLHKRPVHVCVFCSLGTQQYDQNLFNVDEKIQREALKSYYERYDFYCNFVGKRL